MSERYTRKFRDHENQRRRNRYRACPDYRLAVVNRTRLREGREPLTSPDQVKARVPLECVRA